MTTDLATAIAYLITAVNEQATTVEAVTFISYGDGDLEVLLDTDELDPPRLIGTDWLEVLREAEERVRVLSESSAQTSMDDQLVRALDGLLPVTLGSPTKIGSLSFIPHSRVTGGPVWDTSVVLNGEEVEVGGDSAANLQEELRKLEL